MIAPAAQLSRQSFTRLAEFITHELGIKMPEVKVQMLQSRLGRRLRELELESLDDYLESLFSSAPSDPERVQFINAVTTNKTDFFREPEHFAYLTAKALPQLDPNPDKGSLVSISVPWRLKLWCAACSSGEEPYTLAMVLSEYAKTRPGFDFRMLATDVSTKVLGHAQRGIFDASRIEPVALELRRSYLLRSREGSPPTVRVAPELRGKISFHRLNFMDAEYKVKEMFEVIFLRNVLIYFDKPTQEKVINKLCRQLKAGGFLFIGHSESLTSLKVPLTNLGSSIYRKL